MNIMDMHCDTVSVLWYSLLKEKYAGGRHTGLYSNPDLQLDIQKMKKGGYILQNFAMFVDLERSVDFSDLFGELPEGTWNPAASQTSADGTDEKTVRGEREKLSRSLKGIFPGNPAALQYMDPWYAVNCLMDVFDAQMKENSSDIRQVRNRKEIDAALGEGLLCAMLTVEEGGVCEGDTEKLRELYRRGVRMMTLTWNHENELGSPNVPLPCAPGDDTPYFRFVPRMDNGLKPKGREFVELMTELGMIVDVSHLSDAGFYDVADIVKGPFAASHSNARAVCGCNRNMTDEMIRIMGEHGGVIGLNYCPEFVMEARQKKLCSATVDALAVQARHITDVGGMDVLGLGSDYDGIGPEDVEMKDCSMLPMLPEALERAGFSHREIEKICWQNVMRLYSDVLK